MPANAATTFALIGGPMTVEGGSHMDSRQTVKGDPLGLVPLRACAASELWLRTALSLAQPVLEAAGPPAYGIIIGSKSLIALRGDGGQKRRRTDVWLRSQGGVGQLHIRDLSYTQHDNQPEGYVELARVGQFALGTVDGDQRTRWRRLTGMSAYTHKLRSVIKPAVVIYTEPELVQLELIVKGDGPAAIFRAFEQDCMFATNALWIGPHTARMELLVAEYGRWKSKVPGTGPSLEADTRRSNGLMPQLPPQLVVTAADFGVSYLQGAPEGVSAESVEQARRFLLQAPSTGLGLWDLASSPTLRDTLLAGTEAVQPAPHIEAPVPVAVQARRNKQEVEAVTGRLQREQATAAWTRLLQPYGWQLVGPRNIWEQDNHLWLAAGPMVKVGEHFVDSWTDGQPVRQPGYSAPVVGLVLNQTTTLTRIGVDFYTDYAGELARRGMMENQKGLYWRDGQTIQDRYPALVEAFPTWPTLWQTNKAGYRNQIDEFDEVAVDIVRHQNVWRQWLEMLIPVATAAAQTDPAFRGFVEQTDSHAEHTYQPVSERRRASHAVVVEQLSSVGWNASTGDAPVLTIGLRDGTLAVLSVMDTQMDMFYETAGQGQSTPVWSAQSGLLSPEPELLVALATLRAWTQEGRA